MFIFFSTNYNLISFKFYSYFLVVVIEVLRVAFGLPYPLNIFFKKRCNFDKIDVNLILCNFELWG